METTADFIIVGGGTSGLLLASRLASTLSKPTIIVLEAGQDQNKSIYRNPYDRYALPFTAPELDYGYQTVPQVGLANRMLPYARGKGLGGSSLINFMIYLSGAKGDYDQWAKLAGDETWKWENVQRRLKEIETFDRGVLSEVGHLAQPSSDSHGDSGPVSVGLPRKWEVGTKEIIEQVAAQGIHINLDVNSGNPIGISMAPVSAKNGYRTTSASANLTTQRSNLQVWTNATAKRVIFEGTHAVGVELVDGRKVFSKHETILTAGSFASPQLLMLSGIGPRSELSKLNIKAIKHLPGIGQNMNDHPVVFLTALMKPEFSARMAFETSTSAVASATKQWNEDGAGEFAHQMQSLGVMFNKLPSLSTTPEYQALSPDQQLYLEDETIPTYECTFGGPKFPPSLQIPSGFEYLGISVFGMNPQGSGTLTLSSADINDAPIIDPNLLTNPYDRLAIISSIADSLRIFQATETYKQGFISWLSGPKSDSLVDIEAFVDGGAFPVWHACGTAKMGKVEEEDEGVCVDGRFRVLGVEGLRVADMSVAPLVINGHTQAVAYLIGATAAEKLIEEYRL
ncbi:hypothetical protein VTL71DRAFT_7224 [Oculimacula yallundae]|uniref:Glucose-methanol-choline oxidoreductase N-terminal domain-containing protein n=1 Tax=Oculimacula yallundae TaxID=86028 RepID=A0ABR4BXK0_9HELO